MEGAESLTEGLAENLAESSTESLAANLAKSLIDLAWTEAAKLISQAHLQIKAA